MTLSKLLGALSVVGALAVSFGCSSADSDNVVWTCNCSWTRDGTMESSDSQKGCGTKDDAQKVVDAQTAQCQSELDAVCTGTCEPCTCQCTPGKDACTPA